MFDSNYKNNFYSYYFYFSLIFFIYAVVPYILQLSGLFEKTLFNHFPKKSHEEEREYILLILSKINFNYLFLLNIILFAILAFISVKILVKQNENIIKIDEKFIFLSQIIIILCLFFLLKDLLDYLIYYKNIIKSSGLVNPFLDRNNFYQFFLDRRQTHFIVGSIFSIFCLKHNKILIPLIFLSILSFIEFSSLSRFYIFLIFSAIIVISKKKYFPILFFVIFLIITYRFFLLNGINGFFSNFTFEPVSLVSNEIIKILNGLKELEKINFFYDFIKENVLVNFLFFDYNKSYYIFNDIYFKHFRSFAQYGLLDILAYPIQIILLCSILYILGKILNNFHNLSDLYLITNVFSLFMIVRGSAIYGLSFIIKMQLIFFAMTIIILVIEKIKVLKI